jgi:hypothetical protein
MRLLIILGIILILVNIISECLIINAKLCKITYSKTGKFNISKNRMLRKYVNYSLINETKTKSICYIFNNNEEIDICFKGSSNIIDIYYNFDIYQKKYLREEIKVHNGFLNKYLSIKSKLIEKIKEIINKNDIKIITFNGHSSGGAMAMIATLDIRKLIRRDDMIINCITFGSPKISNDGFIEEYNRNINNSYRVIIKTDIIQYLPFTIGYNHVHEGIIINDEKDRFNIKRIIVNIYEYFKIKHGISNYIKGLYRLDNKRFSINEISIRGK